jgi:hypothetical protein
MALWLKVLSEKELAIQLEWRLSAADVAGLLGVTRQAVNYYSRHGRKGWPLGYRLWGAAGSKRCYNMGAVERFAEKQGWVVQYDTLPEWVQREWRVGKFSHLDAKHDTLASTTERKDTP